jgi:hypothetical protein
MKLYVRYKYIGAAYIELNKEFGAAPLYGINSCNGETIIDIPYGQIILTPPAVLKRNSGRAMNDNDIYNGIYNDIYNGIYKSNSKDNTHGSTGTQPNNDLGE